MCFAPQGGAHTEPKDQTPMSTKFATLAQALIVTAGLALAPAAFAQTSTVAPTAPTVAPAPKAAEVKPAAKAPVQTADAACAVHKKDSKEFKDCTEKAKLGATKTAPAPAAAAAKDAVKKTN
jgi:hypothetical protein